MVFASNSTALRTSSKMPSTRSTRKPSAKQSKTTKKDNSEFNLIVTGALNDMRSGMSIANAAEKWDITKNYLRTLSKKMRPSGEKGKVGRPAKPGSGSHALLSKEEEAMVVDWIADSYNAGFSLTEDQVLNSIQYLLTELGKQTPFPYNRPSRKWFDVFLLRNPEISMLLCKKVNSPAMSSQNQIDAWFEKISNYLQNINLFDVLKDPDRMFNGDELGFFINPYDNKVLFKRGAQKVFQIINIDQRLHVAMFLAFSASGMIAPPMLISQQSASLRCFQQSVPDGWFLGISENGWMTGKTFFEYIVSVFKPWLDENNIPKPVIVFFNSSTTHLTLQLSRWCHANGIVLVGALPNDAYVVQPLDVSLFGVLRTQWFLEADRVRREDKSAALKVSKFCSTLQKVIAENLTPELIQTGFQKCGIFPWDPLGANFESLIKDFDINEAVIENMEVLSSAGDADPRYKLVLKILEGEIGENKVKSFYALKNESRWFDLVDQKDISLFRVWKQILSKAEEVPNWVPENYCEVVITDECLDSDGKDRVTAEDMEQEVLAKDENKKLQDNSGKNVSTTSKKKVTKKRNRGCKDES
nr:PREDICTED: uncharacterized protein LOC109039555 [Bemisia tabaci]